MPLHLTPRETEIISLILRGYGRAEIAEQLGVKHNIVRVYSYRAYKKLGCSTRLELLAMARAQGALNLWLCDSLEPSEAERRAWDGSEKHDRIRELLRRNYAA